MAQAVISDKNLTPLIQIISWFMLVVAAFALLLRAVSRVYLIRRDGTDDSLVFAAFVSSFISTPLHSVVSPRLTRNAFEAFCTWTDSRHIGISP